MKATTMVLLGLAMLAGTASSAAPGDEVANFVKTLATKNMQGVSGKASPAVAEKRLGEQGSSSSAQEVRVSEILCERHTMMLPRSMYATQEEDAGCDAGH